MFLSLIAAALAASTPTPAPVSLEAAIEPICVARFAENVALVADREPPNSLVIPLLGLDDDTAKAVTQRCDMFDRGIAFAMKVKPVIRVPAPLMEREGLAPDRSGDPATSKR